MIRATVAERSDEARFDLPATQGAEYLSRHDIACQMVELPAEIAQLVGSWPERPRRATPHTW